MPILGPGIPASSQRPNLARRPTLARQAEELAARALEAAGMTIVERNWRRPQGEIDLVALDVDGTCVFCEVRSRTGTASGDPLEAVTPRKQAQVVRCARLYLSEVASPSATAYRFDVVAVTFDPNNPPTITHLPAAFETTP